MARGAQGAPAAPVPSPRARRAGRRAPFPSPPQPASTPRGPPGAGRRRMGKRFCRSSRALLAGSGPTRPDSRHPPLGGLRAAAIGNLRPCDRAHTEAEAGARQPAPGPRRAQSETMSRCGVGGLIAFPATGSRSPPEFPIAAPGAARAPPRRRAQRGRTPARPGATPPAPSRPGWTDAHPPSRAARAARAGA